MPVMSNTLIAPRGRVAMGALLVALMSPTAMAAKICTLGPPSDGMSTVENSLGHCLERLRRYDGEPDGYGRVYARYGNVDLAVDAAGSYRYYEDGQTWAQFAGAPGWKPVLMRDLDPPGKVAGAPAPEAPAEPEAAETPRQARRTVPRAVEVAAAAPEAASAPASAPAVQAPAAAPAAPAPVQPAVAAAAPSAAGAAAVTATAATDTAVSFGAQRRATVDTPVTQVDAKAPVVSRDESGERTVTYVDPRAVPTNPDGTVVRCQYRDAKGWHSSNQFTLESCAAHVREVHTAANTQGMTQGYWNGIYIAVSAKSTYVSRDGGNAWEPLR